MVYHLKVCLERKVSKHVGDVYSVFVNIVKEQKVERCREVRLLDAEGTGDGVRTLALDVWRDVVLLSDPVTLVHGVATDDTLPEIVDHVWAHTKTFMVGDGVTVAARIHELPRGYYAPPRTDTVRKLLKELCEVFNLCTYLSTGTGVGWFLSSDTAIAMPQDTPNALLVVTKIAPTVIRNTIGKAGTWLTTTLGFLIRNTGKVEALFGAGVSAVHPFEIGWERIGRAYCNDVCTNVKVIDELGDVLKRIHSKEERKTMKVVRHTKPLLYGVPIYVSPDIRNGGIRAVLRANVEYPELTPEKVRYFVHERVEKFLSNADNHGVAVRNVHVAQHINTASISIEIALSEKEPPKIAHTLKSLSHSLFTALSLVHR